MVPEATAMELNVKLPHTINCPPLSVNDPNVDAPEKVCVCPEFTEAPFTNAMAPAGEQPGKAGNEMHWEAERKLINTSSTEKNKADLRYNLQGNTGE
jgi:hypothetical protein